MMVIWRRPPELAVALAVCGLLAAGPGQAQSSDPLARAQELLDAERAEEAIVLLDGYLEGHKTDAHAHLLRSTARFVLGDRDGGEKDLARALKLDPTLRQAWLNQAGVLIVEERYDEAYQALAKAKELDPSALDNELNLGVVQLLRGELQAASRSFERHVAASGDSADALYVVASNYALAGYTALAIEHLQRAIETDERARLRARADPNFGQLAADRRFQDLLNTDRYQPPPGSYSAARRFATPYSLEDGKLLGAVIDALRRGQLRFSPHVEATPNWALIWSDMRIKVSDHRGQGLVELTAPADGFTPAEWRELSERLFRQIAYELSPKVGPLPKRGSGPQ